MAVTQPTATLDRATRRATVRRLADVEGLSNREIARRLGIGKDTVRRDLDATAPGAATPAPTSGATLRHDGPSRRFVLDLDDQLAAALCVLVDAMPGARHTPDAYRAAARAAIRATADSIRETHAAELARRAPSGRVAGTRT